MRLNIPTRCHDALAADFPNLKIILGTRRFHGRRSAVGRDPQAERLYRPLRLVAEIFPPILVRYINSILQDKMLFGSDWPVIRLIAGWRISPSSRSRDENQPKVLKAKARSF